MGGGGTKGGDYRCQGASGGKIGASLPESDRANNSLEGEKCRG